MKMPATPSHQNRSVLTTLISRFRPQNSGSKLRRRTRTCLLGVCGLPPGNSADPVGIAEPYHDNTLGLSSESGYISNYPKNHTSYCLKFSKSDSDHRLQCRDF